VRGLVRVGSLDRDGSRIESGLPQATRASAGPAEPEAAALTRFDAGPVLAGAADQVAGILSILRAVEGGPGEEPELHRALVPFAGGDLGAGLTAFLRNDRAGAGEMALEVLYRRGDPLAAVAGALVLPDPAAHAEAALPVGELGARLRGGVLCGYRCTELPAHSGDITPKMLLDEIYPVAAYYQDTWSEGIGSVRVAGLGARLPDFVPPLESEFHCNVSSLLHAAVSDGRIPHDARPLADREADGLVGWMMHRN